MIEPRERPITAVSHGWDRSLASATKFIKEHMGTFIFSSPAVFEPSASFCERTFARSNVLIIFLSCAMLEAPALHVIYLTFATVMNQQFRLLR